MLRRQNGHVLRRALDFEVDGQSKKGRLRRTWKRQVEEESMMIGLRRVLDFEVEGQSKKGRLRRTWKKQVEEESVKVGLRRKDALCKVECWCKSDCCWVEVNLATFSCLGF